MAFFDALGDEVRGIAKLVGAAVTDPSRILKKGVSVCPIGLE
jgi:hypothetical protein